MGFAVGQYYTCKRKKVYCNPEAAKERAAKRSMVAGIPLYTYKCPVCRGYHLTKQAPPKIRTALALLEQRNYAENVVLNLLQSALSPRFT